MPGFFSVRYGRGPNNALPNNVNASARLEERNDNGSPNEREAFSDEEKKQMRYVQSVQENTGVAKVTTTR